MERVQTAWLCECWHHLERERGRGGVRRGREGVSRIGGEEERMGNLQTTSSRPNWR